MGKYKSFVLHKISYGAIQFHSCYHSRQLLCSYNFLHTNNHIFDKKSEILQNGQSVIVLIETV